MEADPGDLHDYLEGQHATMDQTLADMASEEVLEVAELTLEWLGLRLAHAQPKATHALADVRSGLAVVRDLIAAMAISDDQATRVHLPPAEGAARDAILRHLANELEAAGSLPDAGRLSVGDVGRGRVEVSTPHGYFAVLVRARRDPA